MPEGGFGRASLRKLHESHMSSWPLSEGRPQDGLGKGFCPAGSRDGPIRTRATPRVDHLPGVRPEAQRTASEGVRSAPRPKWASSPEGQLTQEPNNGLATFRRATKMPDKGLGGARSGRGPKLKLSKSHKNGARGIGHLPERGPKGGRSNRRPKWAAAQEPQQDMAILRRGAGPAEGQNGPIHIRN